MGCKGGMPDVMLPSRSTLLAAGAVAVGAAVEDVAAVGAGREEGAELKPPKSPDPGLEVEATGHS